MSTAPFLAAYGFIFNSQARSFDLDGWVRNLTSFFDQVSVATLTSNRQEDDTLDRLMGYQTSFGPDRFKVTPVDMDIKTNNRFDGQLKTTAMRACDPESILVIMDADERVVPSLRPLWNQWATLLKASSDSIDGFMIPVIDLYSSRDLIRADRPVGVKFRMHTHGVARRGVPAWAERADGLFDTSQSDSTEPMREDGSLARFIPILSDSSRLAPHNAYMLAAYPYVLHEGFLDLARRAELGRSFWKSHWENRSGRAEQVATEVSQLEGVPLVPHGLPLDTDSQDR